MRFKKSTVQKKYEGMGLIEAVIAIAVAGIACLVFLEIALQNTIEVSNMEKIDSLTKKAVVVSEQIKIIVDKQNALEGNDRVFPPITGEIANGSCYKLSGSSADPAFPQGFAATCTVNAFANCKTAFAGQKEFGVYCITSSNVANNLVIGKVITGLVDCTAPNGSTECPVADYEYMVISRLRKLN